MAIFSTFNPSSMPAELIEGTFVQREAIAERLVDIFDQSARRESKHNVLLVGPRGIGKSHLVSLVYHRLKAKTDLADKLCIAYLKEDEWGITSFLDLLVRTLHAIFEEVDMKIPDNISELSNLSKAQAEDYVWRCLQQTLGTKTLFLIIENLDSVFQKIGEQGQRQWRALMQTYPQWAVLATTPALFSDISRQVSPFYGFFEVIHLKPLSFNDATALLQKLARLNNDKEIASFLETPLGRARVRAVEHLAGGNHRIFVLFYEFLNQSGSKEFVTPLVKTVDALTPYYQAQMSRLSPQQQKIISFLCEHRKPATVTVIATNCFTTHQTAASQLKQLLVDRYVRVDRIGREAYYELAEPLLRICVEAKTHREGPLHLLVEFIRYWFSRDELERKLSHIDDRDPGKSYFSAALGEYEKQDAHAHLSPEIGALCQALSLEKDTPERLKAQAEELAELSKIAEDWSHYTRAMVWLERGKEAIPTLEKVLEQHPYDISILHSLGTAHASAGLGELAHRFFDRVIELNPNLAAPFYEKARLLSRENRNEEALKAFDQATFLDPDMKAHIVNEKAGVLVKMERYEAARKLLSPFLAKGKEVEGVFAWYGVTLMCEEKFKDALEYFEKATKSFPEDAFAVGNKGLALDSLERHEDAIRAFDRALVLTPGNKQIMHHRCQALLSVKEYGLAADTTPPEILSHNIFHELLKILNQHPKQGRLQQQLLDLQSADDSNIWQDAFIGSLVEFASFAKDFDDKEDFQDLQTWNLALNELFAHDEKFAMLLKVFDVLTRVKVFNDRKALLELPREQRLLLVGEEEEDDFLNPGSGSEPRE